MVGRSGPLARLVGLVEAAEVASGDDSGVALVTGEAGVGKTRLIEEFLRTLASDEELAAEVVVVRAEPGSVNRPYDSFAQLLRSGPAPAVDDDQQTTAVDEWLIDSFVKRLAGVPLVLVVEDVHWIDDASAAVIDTLARQPWPSFVLVITSRAGALRRGAPGGELVRRLEQTHAVEQVRLERLDRDEVANLVAAITGEQPSSALVEAVARRSEGVPFVVEELVRAAALDRGSVAEPAAVISSVELPWSLNDAVHQQLGGLEDDERRVVDALAVYDDPASFDTLVIVTELDEAALLGALRNLVGRGAVIEVSDDRFWFAHALMADTIAQQLLGRERRRLHERCFDALSVGATEASTDDAARARHAIGAGRYDEVAGIARTGARRALKAGASFVALRLAADGLEEEPDDPGLLAIATDAAWRLGFHSEASVTAERWVQVAGGEDLVDALRLHSRLRYELGDAIGGDDALGRLRILAGDESQPAKVRGAAAASTAQLCMLTARSAEAVSWADIAIDVAARIGDDALAARASVERATARSDMVSRRDAEPELRAAVELARRANDAVATARGLNNLLAIVAPHTAEGAYLRAELPTVAGRAGFNALGHKRSMWDLKASIGAGDLPAARRLLLESTPTSVSGHCRWMDNERAWMAIEEGRYDDAERLIIQAANHDADLLGTSHEDLIEWWLRLLLHAFRGDHAHGVAAFRTLIGLPPPGDDAHAFNETIVAAESALAVGVAPSELRESMLDRWLVDHPSTEELRAHIEGLIAVADDDPDAAIAALEPRCGNEELQATTRSALRMALTRAYIGAGDRRSALDTVDHLIGIDLAKWPGVRRDRAETLRHRIERSRPEGPTATLLTQREQEVAVLLVDGLTNGQVAERLYISPKTAAVHVSNILAKLGLSSRAEIAAWTVRNSLDASGAPRSA